MRCWEPFNCLQRGMAEHHDLSVRIIAAAVLAAQSCPTLCNLMDCSPPGSSVHGISQARILEWAGIPFSRGIFLTQGSNPHLLHCRQILYHLSHQGSPGNRGRKFQRMVSYSNMWIRAAETNRGGSTSGAHEPCVLCQVTFWKARPDVHPDRLCCRIQFGTSNL